ncbi:hypothetical protein [Psychroserpens sp. Hel_I_66]|uniref:hypothetical protein n=1 Tax=Psychroserpens sp. Hel_I_66 TaxID=1250004 RepID=UPI000648B3D3|nr:hypothetical protein [Psychroserpens sp. Hel_I_66]
MKNTFIILMTLTFLVGCKNDKTTEENVTSKTTVLEDGKTEKQSDGLIAIQGEFIYYADAAVLKTSNKIFGVVLNDKVNELQDQVKAYKKEDTDMVPVTVRGRIFKKDSNEEGWEDKIEIKEILNVSPPKPEANDVIKIGNK